MAPEFDLQKISRRLMAVLESGREFKFGALIGTWVLKSNILYPSWYSSPELLEAASIYYNRWMSDF